MLAEEEHHVKNPLNNEDGNLRDGEIWVDLNDSRDNKFELKWNVKELRSIMRKVKEYIERILKAREELNYIMLAKIHNDERDKNKKYEQ